MRIIFSAGGTGGHLYPALALANYISKHSDATILFVGSIYRIEASKVQENGYDFHGLDIKTPSGSIVRKIKGYLDVYQNIAKCVEIIDDFKPDLVIGFGGYTSYSMMKAALKCNVKTIIHEQNSVLGKSNKLLAKKVDALVTSYDLTSQYAGSNVYCLGNPTSYQVMQASNANLNDYDLSNDIPTLLVVMGSQGSQIIDNIMWELLNKIDDISFQIIYVSGPDYYERYKKQKLHSNIKVIGYDDNLISLIKACDLIVSRAGASALTEIISANKPSILIPSIHVTNNHQCLNAKMLVDAKCAVLIDENKDTSVNLMKSINEIMCDEQQLLKMSKQTKVFNYNDSAMNIYNLIKELLGDKNAK